MRLGTSANDFIWAAGIENSFVPQIRPGHRAMDQYELIGHYEHWREDLLLAKQLGLKAMRWGVPWYRVEPEEGKFDWTWVDQVIPYMVNELQITPIVDLMHYGCPFWLKGEFSHDKYPETVGRYARAFTERYHQQIKWYTPLNEPIINALMCGMKGHWPPYLRGERGYVKLMLQLVKGIHETVSQIRAVDPSSLMVHVDACGLAQTAHKELEALANEDRLRSFFCYDLLTGRISPNHGLYTWLVRNGASTRDLSILREKPMRLDVMGMNFYPQWSTAALHMNEHGHLTYQTTEHEGGNFGRIIEEYYKRYQVPVMITETSHHGDNRERSAWLRNSLTAIKELRSRGVPVHGYTWFPLMTMINWKYRLGRKPLDQYYLELGLYKLNRSPGPRWLATPLVDEMKACIDGSVESVGHILSAQPGTEMASERVAELETA